MEELIRKILEDVTKSAKATSPNHDEVVEMKKDVTMVAKHTKMQYDQFIAVGFSEEQAMQLTIALLN